MKKVRNIGFILCGTAILIVFVYHLITNVLPNNTNNKYDIDINNFDIETLTEEQIVSTDGNSTAFLVQWSAHGSTSGINNFEYEDADHERTNFSAEKITGIKTVSATLAKDCTLSINISSKLKNGSAKIAIVMDDNVVDYLDGAVETTVQYTVVDEHRFYVKILCEQAQIEINTKREIK